MEKVEKQQKEIEELKNGCARNRKNQGDVMPDVLKETFLFDFSSPWGGGNIALPMGMQRLVSSGENPPEDSYASNPVRIKIKPVDVLAELETVPAPQMLNNLDDKIKVLEIKKEAIRNFHAAGEIQSMLDRLNNRKRYAEFHDFFSRFQNTTDEKIDALLSKYELEKHPADIFIPEFPAEAAVIMKEYSDKVKELCGQMPVFYVIAPPALFRKAYEKRDPILLVQSPFGFYWQILGAWDKEMVMLTEL